MFKYTTETIAGISLLISCLSLYISRRQNTISNFNYFCDKQSEYMDNLNKENSDSVNKYLNLIEQICLIYLKDNNFIFRKIGIKTNLQSLIKNHFDKDFIHTFEDKMSEEDILDENIFQNFKKVYQGMEKIA